MAQYIAAVTVVVPDYDEAIAFYVGKLGFRLIEDTVLSSSKRWVLVSPQGSVETHGPTHCLVHVRNGQVLT
jgi:catechol 2,3-dioxygenase-like lactoylglutathione lyase family enzyme